MKRYHVTAPAEADLRAIRTWYVDNRSVESARRVMRDLRAQMQQLATTPTMGKPREHLAPISFFFWPHRRYLIVYRPGTEPLQIIRVWDTSQNPARFRVR